MYTIYVIFKCVSGKREEYVERMKEKGIVDAIRNEEGCVSYNYYFSEKDSNEILLIEAWESKKHQGVHMEQPHMKTMFEIKQEYVISTKIGEFELK